MSSSAETTVVSSEKRAAIVPTGTSTVCSVPLTVVVTRMVRPHLAIVTAIAPAHIENLGSEEAIADAKGEIFEGLEPEGIAIVPNDTPHRDRLVRAARRYADQILTFGSGDADVHALHAVRSSEGGSLITAA